MPRESSFRRTLGTTARNAEAGPKRGVLPAVIVGFAVFAGALLQGPAGVAQGDDQPAVDASASVPPPGLILDETAAQALLAMDAAEGVGDEIATGRQRHEEQRLQTGRLEQISYAESEAARGACGEQSKECQEALKTLRDDDIASIALDIRVGGRPGSDYPCECRLEGESFQPRRFATTMMTWKAAGNCHKPLYFEDWNLERYGHSHGPLDPVFSAAHFFVTLPVLPYKMGVELPWECIYPLGYYRPGNCAPWTVPAVPISCRGFAAEAATVTGLVFLLP